MDFDYNETHTLNDFGVTKETKKAEALTSVSPSPSYSNLIGENNKILVGKKVHHGGALHGLVSNGGKITVGEYQIEIVAKEGLFRTIQIYRYGLDSVREKQNFVRTKTKVVKEDKKTKKEPTTLQVEEKVKQVDLL